MLIAARNSFLIGGAKLPYDAEVDYIESSVSPNDDQWINTGVVAVASSIKFVGRVKFGDYPGGELAAFGNFNGGSSGTFFGCAQSYWYSWHGSGTGWKLIALTLSAWYNAEYHDSLVNGREIIINGVRHAKSGNAGVISNGTAFRLFGRFGARAAVAMANAKIYVDGTLVRDYQPVRVGSGSSAVGYLYDRANPDGGPLGNGLYPNAGTGAFVVGPDKP